MKLFLGNSLWQLVSHSDTVTKLIMIGLLVASIICWTIVFYKVSALRAKFAQVNETLKQLRTLHSLEQVQNFTQTIKNTYSGFLLAHQIMAVKKYVHNTAQLTERQVTLLDEIRFSLIDDMVQEEQKHLSLLSVTAAVAPLIGLFGTVWGLTHAFLSISEKQGADIATVAPGIAEALITTLAGLIVAVPALIFYHYLQNKIDLLAYQLTKISEHVHFLAQGFVDENTL
ncbi:MotA/TolQ/ExbB proton channel family protein [bacterium]|nr:MotA/TolQ/ExbB proton channel family protein [bacterium]